MSRLLSILAIITICVLGLNSWAHEGEHKHSHDETSEVKTIADSKQPILPKGFILPEIEGPKPWSDKPVLNDENRFQIAIMTDRTGGHRPGVWMDAVTKINQLRPEFVMSVGDLIEGYSTDEKLVNEQWGEFLGFIDKMDMRFFFVAGNHDVTNPVMHKLWREHFGPEWYSFDYKDVHFVCLSSEDPEQHLSEKQIEWIADDLEKHKDARWTLLFLHKPLWVYAERDLAAGNDDRTNWKRVEKLLAGRPHTVFAGHVHHYVQYKRNGQGYYSLATTGGGSGLRGNEYGEFDHIMWLTMEEDGPHLVNLRLDGILPADIVTEESHARFNSFLRQTSVSVEPILLDVVEEEGFTEGDIVIRLRNDFDEPVEMTGEIDGLPLRGISVDPLQLKLAAEPGKRVMQKVRVRFEKAVDFPSLARTSLTAKVRTTGDDPLMQERVAPVLIDRRFNLTKLDTLPEIDGEFEAWPEKTYRTPDEPLVLGSPVDWKGPNDASAEFFTQYTRRYLYVGIRVTDEAVLADLDRVELLIDGRRVSQRKLAPGMWRDGISASMMADAEAKPNSYRLRRERPYDGVIGAAKTTDKGYDIELAVPLRAIKRLQGNNWHSVQMTLVVHDADEKNQKPSKIIWRGTPDVATNNTGYGHFVREE